MLIIIIVGSELFFKVKSNLDKENLILLADFYKDPKNLETIPTDLQLLISIKLLELQGNYVDAIHKIEENLLSKIDINFNDLVLGIHWINFLLHNKEIDQFLKIATKFSQDLQKFNGTQKEEAFLKCSFQIAESRYDSFQHNLDKMYSPLINSLEMATRYQFFKEMAEINNLIARYFFLNKNIQPAMNYLDAAYQCYENAKNENGMAGVLNNLSLIQYNNEKIDEAIANLKKAMNISEKYKDNEKIAHYHANLGNIFTNIGNFVEGKKHITKSLELYKKLGDKQRIATQFSNLGTLHFHLKNHTEAKKYLSRSIAIFKELDIEFYSMEPKNVLFLLALEKNDETEAFLIYSQMMAIWNTFPKKVDSTYLKIGNLLLVIQFKEVVSLVNPLQLLKEILFKTDKSITFHFLTLIALIKILNSKIITDSMLEYTGSLKDIISQLQIMAKQTSSYFILIHSYLLDGSSAYVEKNSQRLKKIIAKLEKLNLRLHLTIIDPEIFKLKEKLREIS